MLVLDEEPLGNIIRLTVSYYGAIPCTVFLRVSTGFDIDDKPVMGYLLVC